MNAAIDLSAIGAGFDNAGVAAQQVFRDCLWALGRPGRIVEVAVRAETPAGVHPAANALLLALLDHDTRLWLSPGARQADPYLRFHTGCSVVQEARDAEFALAASPQECPSLGSLASGNDERPELSATLLVQVEALTAGEGWRLSGPGLREPGRLSARGLGAEFVAQWARNHASFPRGVDVLLVSGERICGLPRTTRIEA
jgi:alpha-D-ribose 1-methylphosphonate 5-triphosphate synthase subunit PhnH